MAHIKCGTLILKCNNIDPNLVVDSPNVKIIGQNDSALSFTNVSPGAMTTTIRYSNGSTGSLNIVKGNYSIDIELNGGSLAARINNGKLNRLWTSRSFQLSDGTTNDVFRCVADAAGANRTIDVDFDHVKLTFKVAVGSRYVVFAMA